MPTRRVLALLLAVTASGCAWDGRPDGAAANHSPLDGVYDNEGALTSDPVYGARAEIVEPLDGEAVMPTEAPVDLTQPAPTTGTQDNTSEVEEALTPGTEQ